MKRLFVRVGASLLLLVVSSTSWAGCPREDVEFYLKQGFTTDQIAVICNLAQPQQMFIPPGYVPANAPGLQSESLKRVEKGLDASDIKLTKDTFTYVANYCFETGKQDIEGYKTKECPEIQVDIETDSMKVVKVERRELLKPPEILVRGKMTWTILTEYYPDVAARIKAAVGNPNQAWLPTRRGKDAGKTMAALRKALEEVR